MDECPNPGCSCGIYAVRDKGSAYLVAPGRVGVVVGQVALWGRVIVHEHGYRAEKAYPLYVERPVWMDRGFYDRLVETYGLSREPVGEGGPA